MVRRRPNPRDGRGTLAEITPSGRDVVTRSTADLMAARFGMAEYDPAELAEIFTLLRGLRVIAGDFREQGAVAVSAPGTPPSASRRHR
jgi:DNA-binding MarR family transcriptional regulator